MSTSFKYRKKKVKIVKKKKLYILPAIKYKQNATLKETLSFNSKTADTLKAKKRVSYLPIYCQPIVLQF